MKKFGIRGRMFFAFGFIALVTIGSSIIAWLVYEGLSDKLSEVVQRDIPAISIASRLVERGGFITASAPLLANSSSERERQQATDRLKNTLREMRTLIKQISQHPFGQDSVASIDGPLTSVAVSLKALDENVKKKFILSEKNFELSERLRWSHADFLDEIEPLTEDARFNINLNIDQRKNNVFLRSTASELSLKRDLHTLEVLLRMKASINLFVGIISRGAALNDLKSLNDAKLYATEFSGQISQDMKILSGRTGFLSLRQSIERILSFWEGKNSIFELRKQELVILQKGQKIIALNNQLVQYLQLQLSNIVSKVKDATRTASQNSSQFVDQAKIILIGASIGTVVIAIVAIWLYVGRSIVGRITSLDTSMRKIANGNLKASVPIGGDDEIADMADALLTFRDTISETQEELVQAGKLAALGQLSAGIAHELNQPLSAIQSYMHNTIKFIDIKELGAANENLSKVIKITKRMAGKINHLKTLARRPSRDIRDVDINEIIQATLELLDRRISEAQVKVTHVNNGEIYVRGGSIRLEQVILNVIGNALDAMRMSKQPELKIDIKTADDLATIEISDTGHGIPNDEVSKIFDPFFTTKEVGEGLGLGLSISYNIIKDFGGSMKVHSEPNVGTTIFIILKQA